MSKFSIVAEASLLIALVSGSIGPRSRPGWGHCIVFFRKTLKHYLFHRIPLSLGANLKF